MTNLTTEDLLSIYKMAIEYAKAKFGKEPDIIEINDGIFQAKWITYSCGDRDEAYECFRIEDLNTDLETVYNERKVQEEIQRKHNEEIKRIQDIQRAQREKEDRHFKYLQLKKEFEQ